MKALIGVIKQLLCCKHRNKTFIKNIYGDEINHKNGARSEWMCDKCGKTHYSYRLITDFVSISPEMGDK